MPGSLLALSFLRMIGFAIAALALLILVGTSLLAIGFRGRCTDDHALCRRCGFDLFAKPVGSDLCPECGADVTKARSVRVGHRRRRPAFLMVGVICVLAGAVPVAALAVVRARGADWNQYKPVWWLLAESNSAALAELNFRVRHRTVTDAQVRRLAGVALARQADHGVPWNWFWGEIFMSARAAGWSLPSNGSGTSRSRLTSG